MCCHKPINGRLCIKTELLLDVSCTFQMVDFPLNYFLARIFSLPCQAEEVSWSVGGGKDWEKEAAGGGKTETDDGWVQ